MMSFTSFEINFDFSSTEIVSSSNEVQIENPIIQNESESFLFDWKWTQNEIYEQCLEEYSFGF